jgi:tetratricopeptide (TPR) repeat protein
METCADARAAKPERIAACTQAHDLVTDRQVKAYALWYRSDAKLATGDFAGAIADSDEADLLLPDDPAILNGRCWTRAVANWELELARGACDLSINKPTLSMSLYGRGLAAVALGLAEDGERDIQRAASAAPDFARYGLTPESVKKRAAEIQPPPSN